MSALHLKANSRGSWANVCTGTERKFIGMPKE